MIKFIHKKHIHQDKNSGRIIIYYNITDIVLGTVLLILVLFFMHFYLSHTLEKYPANNSICIKEFKNMPGASSPFSMPE